MLPSVECSFVFTSVSTNRAHSERFHGVLGPRASQQVRRQFSGLLLALSALLYGAGRDGGEINFRVLRKRLSKVHFAPQKL